MGISTLVLFEGGCFLVGGSACCISICFVEHQEPPHQAVWVECIVELFRGRCRAVPSTTFSQAIERTIDEDPVSVDSLSPSGLVQAQKQETPLLPPGSPRGNQTKICISFAAR